MPPLSSTAAGNMPRSTTLDTAGPFASSHMRTLVLSLLLIIVTLATYNSVTRNAFLNFDDNPYIVQNPHVHAGLTWETIQWAFTTFDAANWHPLTWLSHALDYQLFQLHPAGHHYENVLLHAACAVLLFVLLQGATGSTSLGLLVAALFALHPVNVESVAWAAERKNVLSMLFFLLTLLAYDGYVRKGGVVRYLTVPVLFALGLMAKPQIITLPFVLLLWDYWPLRRLSATSSESSTQTNPRSFAWLVMEKIPLFLLSILSAGITMRAQHAGNAVRTIAEFGLRVRLENVFVSYLRYIENAFWPWHLAPLYPHPGNTLPAWLVAVAALFLTAITVFVLCARSRRYLLVGWFWFLGTLVPMVGLVQVGEQAMADRYAYIPFIGLFLMIVWGVADITQDSKLRGWRWIPALPVLLALALVSRHQIGYWRDSETLWTYALQVTQRNYMAHDNLAIALAKQGRAPEAVAHFQAAVALHQYPASELLKLGLYEQNNGFPEEGSETYRKVLTAATDPETRRAAFDNLGLASLQMKRYAEAKESYESALRLNPDDRLALLGTGLLALRNQDFALALRQFSHAAKVNPSDVVFLLLAATLRQSGHPEEAQTAEQLAERASPNLSNARNTVAQLLAY